MDLIILSMGWPEGKESKGDDDGVVRRILWKDVFNSRSSFWNKEELELPVRESKRGSRTVLYRYPM